MVKDYDTGKHVVDKSWKNIGLDMMCHLQMAVPR